MTAAPRLALTLALAAARTTGQAALITDAPIQCWFNHSTDAQFASPESNLAHGNTDFVALLVEAVSSASSEVNAAVFDFDLPEVARALAEAHARGLTVRIICDNTNAEPFVVRSDAQLRELVENTQRNYREQFARIDTDHSGQLSAAELRANSDMASVLDILDGAQIPWIDDMADGSAGTGLMHNKYAIIDRQVVLTGSTNWTEDCTWGDILPDGTKSEGNANNIVLMRSPQVAEFYLNHFREMWGDGPGGRPDSHFGPRVQQQEPGHFQVGNARVMVQFSPYGGSVDYEQTTNGTIARMISQSQRSAHLALFVFSTQPICDALEQRFHSVPGYDVEAVFEPGYFRQYWSETLDMSGVERESRRREGGPEIDGETETPNRLWNPPCEAVLRSRLHPWDRFHHKYAVLDGRLVITGSHNWSTSANRQNDENTVFINDPLIANQYEQEFQARLAEARDESRTFEDVPRPQHGSTAEDGAEADEREEAAAALNAAAASVEGAVMVEEIAFTPAQAQAVLALVNSATPQNLDLVVGLDRRAAGNIVEARPIASLEALGAISYVGQGALQKLRDAVNLPNP